jgi:hypothetical protein
VPKNILIFADGTGNESGLLPDESRTNVYKLFRATRTGPDTPLLGEKSQQGMFACYLPFPETSVDARRLRDLTFFGPPGCRSDAEQRKISSATSPSLV